MNTVNIVPSQSVVSRDFRRELAAIGSLLRYPEGAIHDHAKRVIATLAERTPEAALSVTRWFDAVSSLSLSALQEDWTRALDLAPQCTPYVSVHLFGKESFARARLMAGLAQEWRRHGVDFGTELPDHVVVILTGAAALPLDVWQDLEELILQPALETMVDALGAPWKDLLLAAQGLLSPKTRSES